MRRTEQHTVCDENGRCIGFVEPGRDGQSYIALDSHYYFVADARTQREAERILREHAYRRRRS
jgi:hypothetical protein